LLEIRQQLLQQEDLGDQITRQVVPRIIYEGKNGSARLPVRQLGDLAATFRRLSWQGSLRL